MPAHVADHDDLGHVEFDAARTRGDRRVEGQVAVDLVGRGHLDLAQRDRDAEGGRGVGDVHRRAGVLGDHVVAAGLRVVDGRQGQERGLGLHVVDVARVVDAGDLHGLADARRDLLHHGGAADVLGEDDLAHRDADAQPGFVGLHRRGGVDGGEDRSRAATGRRRCRPTRPAGTDSGRRVALGRQDLAERAVGEDAGVVVDAAVALGLADDGEHAGRLDHAVVDQLREPGRVGHALDGDLAYLDGVRHLTLPVNRCTDIS